MRCGVHCLMEHIPGFTRSHWMPPSGECSHHIAMAAAMVETFGQKHKTPTKNLFLAGKPMVDWSQKSWEFRTTSFYCLLGPLKCNNVFSGNFDCHADATVWCGVRRLMEHIPGFTRSHWMPPSGECLHCNTMAAAMVDTFGQKHKTPTKNYF